MIIPAIILMRPSALLWFLAAGVIVVLYLRPIRPPRAVVARPYLWREVLGDPRSAARQWRRRRLLSAAIHVLIVLLLALAAADPCLRRPRTVVFVVDNSQSMEATDGKESRLARTQELLATQLEILGPREYAAIITTAGQPVVVSPAEQNLARVTAAIQRIHPVDLPSRVTEALDVAARQAAPGTMLRIHLFSDGCFEGADLAGLDTNVVVHPVGARSGNVGLTRLAVRWSPNEPRNFQVMLEATNRDDEAMTAPVRILLNGKSIHQSELQVGVNSTGTLVVDLESQTGGTVAAILDKADSFPNDNHLEVALPSAADENRSDLPPIPALVTANVCETQSPAQWCTTELPPPDRYRVFPLWPWLVLAAIILLAAEWPMYHRRRTT